MRFLAACALLWLFKHGWNRAAVDDLVDDVERLSRRSPWWGRA